MDRPTFGVMYRRHLPPESLIATARLVESEGFDDLWVVEDCFWAGGMTAATAALAATDSLTIGLGIAPAVARNPAVAAMEFGGIARMFPGRLVAGFGHGVADWMRQIGALPPSQLAALGETADVVRRLLRGERVTVDGDHVHLDDVELVFAPSPVPPLLCGVTGPRSIDVAARTCDGLLLPEGSSDEYITAARARFGDPSAPCAVYVLFSVDDDANVARAAVAGAVAEFTQGSVDGRLALLTPDADCSVGGLDLIDRYAVAGTPAECALRIERLIAAGCTDVILVPHPSAQADQETQIVRAARDVLPLIGADDPARPAR